MTAKHTQRLLLISLIGFGSNACTHAEQNFTQGWLHWRGPAQCGVASEVNLPSVVHPLGTNLQWSYEIAGRGTPVIADDRIYSWGYAGEGAELREILLCLKASNGEKLWQREFSDFLSDIIYDRYSIGAPTVDAETGNVYLQTSPGLLICLDRDGKLLWQRSMMERFGRLTFPNGRTGAPAVDGALVIVNAITTNWGHEGPARNRFYAFEKRTGDLVWSSTPGVGPPFLKDSSFCSPVFEWRNGRRLFYAGTGCGNIVCVDVHTGEPIWRYQLAMGGVNSSPLIHDDTLIAIHGKENVDDSGRGRMVAIRLGSEPAVGEKGPLVLDSSHEVWRNDELSMFTSSPVLVGASVYQCTADGHLVQVNAKTGTTVWSKKLGADQLHASPLYADSHLYVPTWHDGFYVIKFSPYDGKFEIASHVELKGACLGAPAAWAGKLYVHTTKRLYCFAQESGRHLPLIGIAPSQAHFRGTQPQNRWVVPAEVLLRPGQKQPLRLSSPARKESISTSTVISWQKYVPPAAKVFAYLDADFNEAGLLVASKDASLSAGAFEGTLAPEIGEVVNEEDPKVYIRGRILPSPPHKHNFEKFELNHTSKGDGVPFAYPPLPWIGARLKWEVRQLDGNKVLAKTLDRVLFQRSMVFIGHADDANYTLDADVLTDGNRRVMSSAGVINQRYIIMLDGNAQQLRAVSNHSRFAVSVPFDWKRNTWYRIRSRVDVINDKQEHAVVRAKAWKVGEAEPDSWQLEARHPHGHRNGSPGLFGFSPQSKFRVYIDNVSVTPNDS